MALSKIPIQLHPDEIRHDEGVKESVWTPGERIGAFQRWTQYWLQRGVETQDHPQARSVAIHAVPCIQDTQSSWKVMFREKCPVDTFGERSAPIGKNQGLIDIQTTQDHNRTGILVWSIQEGYVLDEASVAALFPDHPSIKREGDTWVVYEEEKTDEQRLEDRLANQHAEDVRRKEKREQRFIRTTDSVTGEEIRSLPFSNVDQATGQKIFSQLEAAFSNREQGIQNIHTAVSLCNERGPFVGFLGLFTVEEQARMRKADASLVDKVHKEFYRLMLAEDTRKILEQTSSAFTEHLDPLVEGITNQDAKASITRTMQTWRTNAQNPRRNLYHRSKRISTEEDRNPGHAFVVPTYNENPDFFAVCKMDSSLMTDNVGAGYDATMGILMLRLQEHGCDFLDAINAMHELTHKNQHADALSRDAGTASENQDRYVKAMIESDLSTHGVLEEECEAWSNMIELLFAKIGFGTFNVAEVMDVLGIPRTDDSKGRELLQVMTYGQIYFAGGERKGDVYPPAFVEAIKKEYLGLECLLQVYDEDGFPVPYEAST